MLFALLELRFKTGVADESIKDETGCTSYEYFVSDLFKYI